MFRKMATGIALALIASTSFANSSAVIDTSGLSDAQVAELRAHAAQVVAQTVAKTATDNLAPEKITTGVALAATWGTQAAAAAEGFAKAMGIAARELNLSINEFLKSDAGKLTAALIIWKVAGSTIIHMLYGILFITVGLNISRVIYMRLFTQGYEKVEYKRFGELFTGTKLIRIPKPIRDLKTDGEWLAFWMMVVVTIGTIAIGGVFF